MNNNQDFATMLETARRVLTGHEAGIESMHHDSVISFAHGDGLRPPPNAALRSASEQFLGQHWDNRVDVYQFQVARDKSRSSILAGQRHAYGTNFPEIAFGHGVTGLFNALGQTLRREVDCIVAAPGYYHAWVAWAKVLELEFIPLAAGTQCLPDPIELDRLLQGRRGLLLVANPSYCGQVIPRDLAVEMLEVCRKRRCFLVEDAIFARDVHSRLSYTAICANSRPEDSCILMDSGSKGLGISNARIGWALGQVPTIERLQRTLDATGPSFFAFSLILLEEMFTSGASWCARNRAELNRRRELILDRIDEMNAHSEDLKWIAPFQSGGSHSIVLRLERDEVRYLEPPPFFLTRHFLSKVKLALAPGTTHGLANCDVRLNYGSIGGAKIPWNELSVDAALEKSYQMVVEGLSRLEEGTHALKHALAR
jgi:aspartate/methionine/tyrosine aminotransferase